MYWNWKFYYKHGHQDTHISRLGSGRQCSGRYSDRLYRIGCCNWLIT